MPSGAIITTLGLTKLASATPLNQLNISALAVGDGNGGYPTLDPSMTSLTNEVWRGTPSPPIRDANSPNVLIFEAVIPPSVGGFTVREQAIFDDAGDMIAIGQTSVVEKPLPNNATGVILTVRLHIQLDNAEQVDLFFQDDPTISAGNISNANGGSVQDFIDGLAAPDSTVTVGGVEVGGIGRLNLSSVQELKIRTGLSEGMTVRTSMTTWKITSNANNSLAILGGLYAFPLNGAWLDDWGVDRTGVNPVDVSLTEALSLGRSVMLGQGLYRVNTKKVLVPGATVKGVSEHSAIDARMSDVLFEFPVSTGRSVKVFRDFSVLSTGNEMSENGVAFKFPGVPSGAPIQYTSGYKFENIEIGGGGAFACAWDVSDTFRLTIRDCGYSSVTNPLRFRGSVVQTTVDNLTGNNTDYTRTYGGQNAGVWMESKTYDFGPSVPENIKIMNSSFVVHRIGIRHVGLGVMLQNNDLDFIRDLGTVHAGGDGALITGGYIAPSGTDVPFIGSLVQKLGNQDPVTINGVVYNTYNVVASRQVAIQIGEGELPPYTEPSGVAVTNCKILGNPASWDHGIFADRTANTQFERNVIKAGVIKAGGTAINVQNSKSLRCVGNNAFDQIIYVSAPDPTSTLTVTDNLANVVSEFIAPPPANVEIARNRAA